MSFSATSYWSTGTGTAAARTRAPCNSVCTYCAALPHQPHTGAFDSKPVLLPPTVSAALLRLYVVDLL